MTMGAAAGIVLVILNAIAFYFILWRPLALAIDVAAHSNDEYPRFHLWYVEYAALPFIIGVAAGTGYLWYKALEYLAQPPSSLTRGATLTISPEWSMCLVIALFMAIIATMTLTGVTLRWALGPRFQEYVNVSYKRTRQRQVRLLPWLVGIVTIGSSALFAVGCDWYACFRPNDFVVNPLIGFGERTYRYDQVVEIADVQMWIAPNGNALVRPHVALRFDDGSFWSSTDGGRSPNAVNDDAIRAIIRDKTHLNPTKYDVLPW